MWRAVSALTTGFVIGGIAYSNAREGDVAFAVIGVLIAIALLVLTVWAVRRDERARKARLQQNARMWAAILAADEVDTAIRTYWHRSGGLEAARVVVARNAYGRTRSKLERSSKP